MFSSKYPGEKKQETCKAFIDYSINSNYKITKPEIIRYRIDSR